jgi:predicted O-methyltransferase YrrM
MTKEEFGEKLQKIFHPDDPFPKSEPLEKIIEQYWHKYRVAQVLLPGSILEYGVRGGYSAWSFLQAVPDAFYKGVDLYEERPNDTLKFYHEHAEKVLRDIDAQFSIEKKETRSYVPHRKYDLIHLDACHDREGVCAEMETFSWLGDNGAVLVDDAGYKSVMDGVRDWMRRNNRTSFLFLVDLRGQALLSKLDDQLPALAERLRDCADVHAV